MHMYRLSAFMHACVFVHFQKSIHMCMHKSTCTRTMKVFDGISIFKQTHNTSQSDPFKCPFMLVPFRVLAANFLHRVKLNVIDFFY